MIRLSNKEMLRLKSLIGYSINSLSADSMDVDQVSVRFYGLQFVLNSFKGGEFQNVLFEAKFYETENSS